jgi:hypothetical protein
VVKAQDQEVLVGQTRKDLAVVAVLNHPVVVGPSPVRKEAEELLLLHLHHLGVSLRLRQ